MNRKTAIFTLLMLLSVLLIPTSAKALTLPSETHPSKPSAQSSLKPTMMESQLVNAYTQFGFNLFTQLVDGDSKKNVFVSPTSVAIALSMLYNGAGGDTQQEMANALAIQGMSLEALNTANQALQSTLEQADAQIQLSIANSLWARQEVSFKPQFLASNREYYQAEVTRLNFANPESLGMINRWVKDKTRGKIDKIIERISPDDVLFLINAIYFKGTWTKAFDKSLTQNKPFHLANGKTKQQPLMSRQGKYQYYENSDFQGVSLPYGDGRWSLYVFLPEKGSNLKTFLSKLNPNNWNQWLGQFSDRQGLLEIPRFKLEYEVELNQALAALGMGKIFTRKADFSPMTAASVLVNEVKHKTFVEVNEEGTEAAAVTSIGVRATSIMPREEPFRMIVDRPFFCAIRDNQTGTILFMGAIVDPTL